MSTPETRLLPGQGKLYPILPALPSDVTITIPGQSSTEPKPEVSSKEPKPINSWKIIKLEGWKDYIMMGTTILVALFALKAFLMGKAIDFFGHVYLLIISFIAMAYIKTVADLEKQVSEFREQNVFHAEKNAEQAQTIETLKQEILSLQKTKEAYKKQLTTLYQQNQNLSESLKDLRQIMEEAKAGDVALNARIEQLALVHTQLDASNKQLMEKIAELAKVNQDIRKANEKHSKICDDIAKKVLKLADLSSNMAEDANKMHSDATKISAALTPLKMGVPPHMQTGTSVVNPTGLSIEVLT
jgi:uncharacterized coiled-coil DUF342 family protein